MKKNEKKIGLALGGGGARGCAHIGVIKALTEADIPIHCIAGTSIGSVIGGVYAAGDWDAFQEYINKIKWKNIIRYFDPVIPKRGLFDGKKIKKLLKKMIPNSDFRNARIPYIAVATDLFSGKEVWLKSGDMIEAMRASISIPGIFTPAKIKRRYLVDGGVVNPLPVNAVRELDADIVIAVDLNHHFIREKRSSMKFYGKKSWMDNLAPTHPNTIDVIESSIFLMQDQLTQKNLQTNPPDFLIQPILKSASIFDFHKAKNMIDEGYKKTQAIIPVLKKVLMI